MEPRASYPFYINAHMVKFIFECANNQRGNTHGGRGVPTMGASGVPLAVLWATTPDDDKAASASTKVTIENIVKC